MSAVFRCSGVAYGHCRIQEFGDLVRHPSIMVELASADQIIVLRTGGAFHDARVCRLCRAFSGVSDPLPMFGRDRHDKSALHHRTLPDTKDCPDGEAFTG